MKFKSIKCPSCGASVSLKEDTTKGLCDYCKNEFFIDDDVIRIEHSGMIEITDDTSLKVANTTLNQFKDYDKSLLLYKRLIHKYAHKKDVYIGLIRSITRDFSYTTLNTYQLNEINDYWSKYITLATDKDIQKYEGLIKQLNKTFWYNTLMDMTNNFNPRVAGDELNIIKRCYNSYQSYCENKEKHDLDYKYNQYIADYKMYLKQKNRKRKNITICVIATIITLFGGTIMFLLTENTDKLVNKLNLSEVNKHYANIPGNYEYFNQYFKNTISRLAVKDVTLNNEDKSVDITVALKNILVEKTKVFNFDIIDDMGPVITSTNCKFTDTEKVNVYECFTIYDFTDGTINSKEAIVNTEGIDFKTIGIKSINVTAVDKNGNENSENIDITINQTPIKLNIKLDNNLIVGKNYNLSHGITPNNISDTSVSYSYDKNLVSIYNGKVTALKKGKTKICVISNYSRDVKQCVDVNLELQCKDTYTFKFDGSKAETIIADEVFCPGTYKIYASVLNKDDFYSIKITPKGEFVSDYLTIFKNSSHLNQEGSKYVLGEGYSITTEMGVTSIKLVKQK